MATKKETIQDILNRLVPSDRFFTRAMFGEYALYADNKVVALICDDILYVKIVPASSALEKVGKKGSPYPGAKAHYIANKYLLSHASKLSALLLSIAATLPEKKQKKKL
ncbi:MAG: TfoX/Sxy family protein [Candidatus Abawacabacteria bacterium]|nr:TfoX/Sxy family protein [Candidatus Abawacabacteria bacterium]